MNYENKPLAWLAGRNQAVCGHSLRPILSSELLNYLDMLSINEEQNDKIITEIIGEFDRGYYNEVQK